MSIMDVIRAWEDPEYRKSLSDEERAKLPANPVGEIELTDDDLSEVTGADQSGNSVGCKTTNCTRGNSNNPCRNC
jgi:mersacidin/lichenicidin family type 2 lantibiotic